MVGLRTLIEQIHDAGYLDLMSSNPLAQLGTRRRRYIGAELLPEMTKDSNSFREEQIKYRTIIANHGSRYSPAQRKNGTLVGYFDVILGNSDIARDMTGEEYDALIKLLGTSATMEQAATNLLGWADNMINRALIETAEKERWEAICNAQVDMRGDSGFEETVQFPDPSGHRFNAQGTWSSDAYDPFTDIFDAADLLYKKGFQINRIITRRETISTMSLNGKVRARVGRAVVDANGQIQGTTGRAELAQINASLNADGLPPIEQYDLRYFTQDGSSAFLPDGMMVLVATTERDQTLDLSDTAQTMPDPATLELPSTLGYYAMGRAAGQASPGRVINLFPKENKPPRIEAEGYQTSFPVITEPEAVVVIKNIA